MTQRPRLLETLWLDARFGARALRKNPRFTLTAVAALALGIGATTAIFSVVNAVLLRPLAIPADFVVLRTTTEDCCAVSSAKFVYLRSQTGLLRDVSAFQSTVTLYRSGRTVENWQAIRASRDIFRCFAMPIVEGRGFTEEEDRPDGPPVAVLSESLFRRRFGDDPHVLGKPLSLDGKTYTVVGVVRNSSAIREFNPSPDPDVYLPFQIDPLTTDQGDYFDAVARLQPGVTLAQAQRRLRESTAAFRARFPEALARREQFTAITLRDSLVSDIRLLLWVLLGAVGMVLLIACANVANLLLARAGSRRREIAIRAAIGAGRDRVIRQLLTESLLLAAAGGALGTLLGYSGIRAMLAVNTASLPLVGRAGAAVTMDWRVLLFALLISLATGILFGVLPALESARTDVHAALQDGGARTGAGLRLHKGRAALVASEIGLAVTLLIGAALLIRTFVALYRVDRGFETRNVVTLEVSLANPRYAKTAGATALTRDSLERLRRLPGVAAASMTWCCVPLEGDADLPFDIAGQPPADLETNDVGWETVAPGFFDVFRIPLRRGRAFTDRDDGRAPAVVMINERMARRFWPNRDPLRYRIVIGRGLGGKFQDEPPRQIIGIVANTRDTALNDNPRPTLYVPLAQLPDAENAQLAREQSFSWVVRTQADPRGLLPAIEEQLRQATGLPVSNVRTMDDVVSESTSRQRFNMELMTLFGAAALLLAAVGIYGLMAYTVDQRKREIGIRMALGAEAAVVRRMVVRQGMTLLLAGLLAGLAAAFVLTRLLDQFLFTTAGEFAVTARDPLVFTGVPVILAVVALLAIWAPARQASRIDPMEALRCE